MLEATHTKHAPWTLVDFNDQRRGRLTLIRHLLDQLPDTEMAPEQIDFPPLPGKPLKESFAGRSSRSAASETTTMESTS